MSETGSYDDAALKDLGSLSDRQVAMLVGERDKLLIEMQILTAERDRLLIFNAELDRERRKALEERSLATAMITKLLKIQERQAEAHERQLKAAIEERNAAVAQSTCDGSFERQGKKSHEAAIAALWDVDPTIIYESPAQVIGWLRSKVAAMMADRAAMLEQLRLRAQYLARAIDPMSETAAEECPTEELVARAQAQRDASRHRIARYGAKIAELETRLTSLRAALKRYGTHGYDERGYPCLTNVFMSCTCGFHAILAALEPR